MTTSSVAAPPGRSGRLFLALGLGLAALGIIGYVVQLKTGHLMTPWYLPVVETLGLLLVVAALWRRRSVWRWLALVPAVLLTVAGWAFVLTTRLPAYSGPVAEGRPFPAFTTERADGSSFTQDDLRGEQTSVMVFFRGRW